VVEQLPEHELACGSEPAWERGEGEAVVEQQPPRAPTWRAKCQSGFTTLSPVPLLEQYRCVSFVGGSQIAVELVIREYGGHEDLRGSGRRSVIPYVHG
jgi:hypothetical protein